MFPAFPSKISPELDQLIIDIIKNSAALGQGIHPFVLEEVARYMAKVNSYYTNAMEGNPSKLRDIEAALNRRFLKEEWARNYQVEHLAHLQVQETMLARLRNSPGLAICSANFLSWLHEQFYLQLPTEMRWAKTEKGDKVPVVPGQWRDRGASVGLHNAPEHKEDILHFLAKFEESFRPESLHGSKKVLGLAAAHHRLLWIHPFPDGNGRVARLFTTAYCVKIGLGDPPLWTVSRALARHRQDYDAHLALADQPRRNDWDGRGPLSEENLAAFCLFFLTACKDQIDFMSAVLSLDHFQRRAQRYGDGLIKEKNLSKAGGKLLGALFTAGRVSRASVRDICHVQQRRSSQIIKELLEGGWAHSDAPYGDLRLNISVDMAETLFPRLA